MPTLQDLRQSVLRSALPMVGSAAGATADTLFPLIDAELAKHFEDRNILLTDGGTLTFTGTQLQLTENLNLTLNQKISGAVPQVISLGSANRTFTSSGDMLIAVIDRTAGTATVSIVTSGSALPAAASANQEVFLIAKRIDAGDGTQRLYFRNGTAMNAGQSIRLGASGSGSGSGSGTGDDLDSLQFRASFTDLFTENDANANSSINPTGTNATFNAAKNMYAISYDATKTVTTTGVSVTMSGAPAFTVAVGDMLISGGVAKKITVVTNQTSYTIESAFAANLVAAAATVSQTVYTNDIYNAAIDGSALSAAFGGSSFSEIMVDYKDNATSGSNLWTPNTTPFVAFTATNDNANFTTVQKRTTNETDTNGSTILPSSGISLFIRFFSNATSGSGTDNLITYKAFMQKSATAAGTNNVLWSSYGTTNNSTTPINCTVSVAGGKTTITFTNTFPMGANSGQTVGALTVVVNGATYERFVAGSTPTTDGYYTELSANIIQLDKDYSSQQFGVQVVYSLQVIDSSTTNTTQITNILTNQLKNALLNSAFDIWQRGTLTTVINGTSSYQADRWYAKNSLGTNGVLTYSQVTGTLPGSKFGASMQITTAPTAAQANGCELYQTLENFDSLQFLNQAASFGASVKGLGNVTQVGLQLFYNTSEAKVATALGTEQLVTVNSSTFSVGQLLAQSVGTLPTNSGSVGVRIRITAVSTGNTYDLSNGFVVEQAMLNLGSSVLVFSRAGRNFQDELSMCQRFFEKSYDLTVAPGANTGIDSTGSYAMRLGLFTSNAGSQRLNQRFVVPKRTTPSVAAYSTDGTAGKMRDRTNSTNVNQGLPAIGQTGFHIELVPSSATTSFFFEGHWTADAEI